MSTMELDNGKYPMFILKQRLSFYSGLEPILIAVNTTVTIRIETI